MEKPIKQLGLSYNQLATRAGVRPNTLTELKNNRAKQISFETIDKIVTTFNDIASERELGIQYSIADIIKYEYTKKEESTQ